MTIRLPVFTEFDVRGYQMYPGRNGDQGFKHRFTPGLHLIAGVNGLGKSTLLLMLYHGVAGPASVSRDDFGVPQPEIVSARHSDRFRKRVADGAQSAHMTIGFEIGTDTFTVKRSLYDLSLIDWRLNGASQAPTEALYVQSVVDAMNVGGFADVLIILNLIVFMFEDRGLLMWTPLAQRNVLRSLFMTPDEANLLALRAQRVATSNSAYRNLLYIVNRDRKQLARDKEAIAAADALSAEYHTLQTTIAAQVQVLDTQYMARAGADEARTEARSTLESAKFNYDDLLRELEALKLARVASAFPKASEASHYVIARIVGDKECLCCGGKDGPLMAKWIATVAEGDCLVCGTPPVQQEVIVPAVAVDVARIERAEKRLVQARMAFEAATTEYSLQTLTYETLQSEIDKIVREKHGNEQRVRQIAGTVPPSTPAVKALEERLVGQEKTLEDLAKEQKIAEADFSQIFGAFQKSIAAHADRIRERFIARISDFLVEQAEITLTTTRAPIGESGQSYDWPSFLLSMTSGTFSTPSPRRARSEVSMSQGEFIDLAFRLALVEVAAGGTAAALIFDAPEASLDALFMRRAGAFLAEFTRSNEGNRLIVTSNLTNADMIPALFGAYTPEAGDPEPTPIPRSERRSRVVDLLELAAPTSAVALVGDRYKNLLDRALFPPEGSAARGL